MPLSSPIRAGTVAAVPHHENAAAGHVRGRCGAPRSAGSPPDTTEGATPSRSASEAAVCRQRNVRQDVDGIDVTGQPRISEQPREQLRSRFSGRRERRILAAVLHLLGVTDHYNGGRVCREPHPTRKDHDERPGKRRHSEQPDRHQKGSALQARMLVFHTRMIASPQPLVRMVVLAAGLSTRLGSPKALARIRGTSLIRNTVRLLTPLGTSPIIVVIPARAVRVRAELRGLPVRFIENPRRAQGLSTSVRCGLAAAYPSCRSLVATGGLGTFEQARPRAAALALARVAPATRCHALRPSAAARRSSCLAGCARGRSPSAETGACGSW